MAESTKFDREFLRSLLTLAARDQVDHLLFVSDVPLTADDLRGRRLKHKLLYALPAERVVERLHKKGFRAVTIPPYDFSRMEKAPCGE